jgi:hypothetical protein
MLLHLFHATLAPAPGKVFEAAPTPTQLYGTLKILK